MTELHEITDGRRRYCSYGHGKTRCQLRATHYIEHGARTGRHYFCADHAARVMRVVTVGR